jgi:hypothetical protein
MQNKIILAKYLIGGLSSVKYSCLKPLSPFESTFLEKEKNVKGKNSG